MPRLNATSPRYSPALWLTLSYTAQEIRLYAYRLPETKRAELTGPLLNLCPIVPLFS